MRLEKMTITPAMAHEWLSKQPVNRVVNQSQVSAIARDIKNGEWPLTGDCIRLNKKGCVLDGQHRLRAVIEADRSIDTFVAFDCSDSILPVMDSGRSRSFGDVLKIAGRQYTSILGAMVREVYLLEKGLLVPNPRGSNSITSKLRITRVELLDVLNRYPELEGFAERSGRFTFRRGFLAFGDWYYSARHPRKGAEFFTGVATGENLAVGSPALALRDTFLIKMRAKPGLIVTNETLILGLIFRAMQAHLKGESVRVLRAR